MKKLILVGALLGLSVTVFACSDDTTSKVEAETSLKNDFIQISDGTIDTYQHKDTGCYYAYARVPGGGLALEQMYIEKWQKSVPYCEEVKR